MSPKYKIMKNGFKNFISKSFIIISLLTILFATFIISPSFAKNNISKIEMDVILKNNGSAHIAEKWTGFFNEGTEVYKPIDDKSITVRNLRVSKDGRDFLEVAKWDVNASFEHKAWRYGINQTSSGVELCFGISSYGENNSYTFSYDIDPIIKSYNDYDGFNFQFINPYMATFPTSIMIRFYHESFETPITNENTRIWGFGFNGETLIGENYAIAFSSIPLEDSESAIIMMRFNKGLFAPNIKVSGSFEEEIQNIAFEGSTYEETLKEESHARLISILFVLAFIASFLTPIILIIVRKMTLRGFYKNANYFRDTPNGGDIAMSHVLTKDFNIWNAKEANVIGAIIMKMINDKNLEPLQEKSIGFFGNEKVNTSLKIGPAPTEPIVRGLYDILIKAAGEDQILQENEVKNYLKHDYTALTNYIDSLEEKGHNSLNKNLCYKKILGNNLSDLTENGKKELEEVYGLRKFLNEFSLISERSLVEGVIWENLLVYATLFGLAKKVLDELKKVYPNELTKIENYSYNYYVSHLYYQSIYTSSLQARQAINAARLAHMAASGLGGAVSLGGGGGFSGGGHGGGTR